MCRASERGTTCHMVKHSLISAPTQSMPGVGVKSIDLEPLSLTLTLYRIKICTVNLNNTDKHEINLKIKVIVQKCKMVTH